MIHLSLRRLTRFLLLPAAMLPWIAEGENLPADMGSASQPAAAFSWDGLHAGVNVGGGFAARGDNPFDPDWWKQHDGSRALIYGGQIGYDWQISPLFVAGIENDFELVGGNAADLGVRWYGNGRARAGLSLADSRLLVYGTAGLAGGEVEEAGLRKVRTGWTAGGGTEWAVLRSVSVKLEYLYTDLDRGLGRNEFPELNAKFSTIRLGVNYHF